MNCCCTPPFGVNLFIMRGIVSEKDVKMQEIYMAVVPFVGLQLVGPHFGEERILNVAHQYQSLTDWHGACPPDFA